MQNGHGSHRQCSKATPFPTLFLGVSCASDIAINVVKLWLSFMVALSAASLGGLDHALALFSTNMSMGTSLEGIGDGAKSFVLEKELLWAPVGEKFFRLDTHPRIDLRQTLEPHRTLLREQRHRTSHMRRPASQLSVSLVRLWRLPP